MQDRAFNASNAESVAMRTILGYKYKNNYVSLNNQKNHNKKDVRCTGQKSFGHQDLLSKDILLLQCCFHGKNDKRLIETPAEKNKKGGKNKFCGKLPSPNVAERSGQRGSVCSTPRHLYVAWKGVGDSARAGDHFDI
jgi:hypothetical protein